MFHFGASCNSNRLDNANTHCKNKNFVCEKERRKLTLLAHTVLINLAVFGQAIRCVAPNKIFHKSYLRSIVIKRSRL